MRPTFRSAIFGWGTLNESQYFNGFIGLMTTSLPNRIRFDTRVALLLRPKLHSLLYGRHSDKLLPWSEEYEVTQYCYWKNCEEQCDWIQISKKNQIPSQSHSWFSCCFPYLDCKTWFICSNHSVLPIKPNSSASKWQKTSDLFSLPFSPPKICEATRAWDLLKLNDFFATNHFELCGAPRDRIDGSVIPSVNMASD